MMFNQLYFIIVSAAVEPEIKRNIIDLEKRAATIFRLPERLFLEIIDGIILRKRAKRYC